jgi:type IV secretory pathway TrbL component
MLRLTIFGPGIANGLIAGGPQLGAGAAVGTGLAAAGLGYAATSLAAGAAGASLGAARAAQASQAPRRPLFLALTRPPPAPRCCKRAQSFQPRC